MTRLLTVVLAEMRYARRRVRFWVLSLLLSLFSLAGYAVACAFALYTSVSSPSLGSTTPFYLLGTIDPVFFVAFQTATVFLAFDIANQRSVDRIAEVLDSKPVSNVEYLLGRVIGITFLVWLIVALNVLAMHSIGLISSVFGLGISEPFQLASLLNLLLLDAPVTLVFWCSLVVFLSVLLRVRVLVGGCALVMIVVWFIFTTNATYSLLPIVSPSSNSSLFISEIVMEYPSWPTLITRLASLAGALLFLALGSWYFARFDGTSLLKNATFVTISAILSISSIFIAFLYTIGQQWELDKWTRALAQTTSSSSIDLERISGNVTVIPGKKLEIDLSLTISAAGARSDSFTFVFNPGMVVRNLEVDGKAAGFSFRNGILELIGEEPFGKSSNIVVRVVAAGVPNPRFAYIEAAADYLDKPDVSARVPALVGTDASVFSANYVALMPGSHWYPVPVRASSERIGSRDPKDFFELDLTVEVVGKQWQLVGLGGESEHSGTSTLARMSPTCSINEIGILAADFRSSSIEINDTRFELFLHKKHAANLQLPDFDAAVLEDQARDLLRIFKKSGLGFPCDSLDLVEVPSQLRTVGGGWRMESKSFLPGVVLLKEHGYPRVNLKPTFELYKKRLAVEEDLHPGLLALVMHYFDAGVGTDNPWMSIPGLMWTGVTSASGKNSEVLDQVAMALISSTSNVPFEFFSIYSTRHIADETTVNPSRARYGLWLSTRPRNRDGRPYGIWSIEEVYGTRDSVWDHLEHSSLTKVSSELTNQERLELLLLKSNLIAQGILAANESERVFAWLASVRTKFEGRTYTYNDFISTAHEHEVTVDPFLTDWLHVSDLPGYKTSLGFIRTIASGEPGSTYETLVNVKNTQPVAGFVQIRYDNRYPTPGHTQTPFVRVDAHSSKRISLVSTHILSEVEVVPAGLSLNRRVFAVPVIDDSGSETLHEGASPVVEDTNWSPQEIGYVVDDLDPGFQVLQNQPNINNTVSIGPLAWFSASRLDTSMDNGLPRQTDFDIVMSGVWKRENLEDAYGEFRKTQATVSFRSSFPPVRFSIEIPESDTWDLEYHVPIPWKGNWYIDQRYLFEISDRVKSHSAELDADEWVRGWNKIGTFELNSGEVHVDLIGTARQGPGSAYADAIRWIKTKDSSLDHEDRAELEL